MPLHFRSLRSLQVTLLCQIAVCAVYAEALAPLVGDNSRPWGYRARLFLHVWGPPSAAEAVEAVQAVLAADA